MAANKYFSRAGDYRQIEFQFLLTTLIENMQSGTLFEDASRHIVLANKTFCSMFGIPLDPQALVGVDCRNAVEASKLLMVDPEHFVKRIDDIVSDGEIVTNDLLFLQNGSIFERDYSPIFMDGEHQGHLWQYRDVTVNRRAEESLRKSEEENRAIVNAVPDILFRIRRDGLFLDYHTPINSVLYVPPELFLGKHLHEVMPPDVAADAMKAIEKAFVTRSMVTFEYKLEMNGKVSYYEDRILPLSNNEALSFIRDISDRVTTERQLVQVQKLEGIGTLAGGIAHEFNNLLAMILGSAELLEPQLHAQPNLHKYVARIIQATERGTAISKQLLTFSRPEQNEMKPISLLESIDELQKMLKFILPATIEIKTEVESGTGDIFGDGAQIHQALLNLVRNASYAMQDAGTLTLREFMAAPDSIRKNLGHEAATPYVAVSITDTGAGMSEETMKKIFDPFFSTKGTGKGPGLGLAIVHGIVKHHKGFIDVASAPGSGATFTLYFPSIPAPVQKIRESIPASSHNANAMILLVDDEEILRDTLSEYFSALGFSVCTASNGHEALGIYREHCASIGIVITDLGMPEMGGEELFHALRSINRDVKVIVSSGYLDGTTKERLLSLGITEVITKPFMMSSIETVVRTLLAGSQSDPGLAVATAEIRMP